MFRRRCSNLESDNRYATIFASIFFVSTFLVFVALSATSLVYYGDASDDNKKTDIMDFFIYTTSMAAFILLVMVGLGVIFFKYVWTE